MTKGINNKDWKLVSFGEMCKNLNESERDPLANGIDRYVGLEHIETNNLHINSWGNVADGTTFTKRFRIGQVLFGKRRAYLRKAAVADFDGLCSGDILVFEANEKVIIPELLPFIVNSDRFFDYAIQTSAGSLSPRTKFQDLAKLKFLIPPKDQQGKLAELLWGADEVTQKYNILLNNHLNTLDIYRNTVIYNYNSKIEPLSKILLNIVAGKSLNGSNTPVRSNHEYGVLKVSAVGGNGFEPSENKSLINRVEFIDKYQVKENDILITRANTTELVGRVCLVNGNYPNLMLSDKTLKLYIDEKKANKLFIVEGLKSNHVRKQIEGNATGTGGAMKNISQDEIRNFKLPLPDLATQDKIACQIRSIYMNKQRVENIANEVRAIRKQLINQIFSS